MTPDLGQLALGMNACQHCGVYRMDGQPAVLHQTGCPDALTFEQQLASTHPQLASGTTPPPSAPDVAPTTPAQPPGGVPGRGDWVLQPITRLIHLYGWALLTVAVPGVPPPGYLGVGVCPRCGALVPVGYPREGRGMGGHEAWHAGVDHPIPDELLAQGHTPHDGNNIISSHPSMHPPL